MAKSTTKPSEPKAGRPAREGKAAPHIVCARITDTERAAWEHVAGDVALGTWMRDVCNRAARRRGGAK